MSNRVSRMIRLTLSVCILAIVPAAAGAKTIYVDDDVSGLNDGTSWANAYKCLQDALADANDAPKPVEVRVARGTYKPDQGAKQKAGNREATFQLINGVTLKGGYAGLGQPDPNARDIESYETILSGDLNGDDAEVALLEHLLTEPTRAENSYHVVTASGTDGSAVLDGFTVMNGNANIWSGFGDGAGMYVGSGSPTVANCTFTTNSAHFGGGMYSGLTSNPTLTNCAFHGNSAGRYGGGMDNWHGSPTLTNCIFSSNWAFEQGGGIHTYESSPLLTNCKFIANLAGDGGGVYSWHSSPTVIDCTFIENRAGIGGGIYATISSPTLTNCTFTANEAFYSGGGLSSGGESLSATKCTFMANKAGTNGGGLSQGSRSSTLTHCRFIANAANGSGGGMSTSARSLTVANCMFGGNSAEMGGGVYSTINVFIRDNERILNNCTFAGNSAQDGNALASHNIEAVLSLGNLKLTNCIVWDGANEIWNHDGSKIMISYGDVQGGQASIYDPRGVVIWGDGNMDADPLFANPGRWADANDPNVVLGPRDPNAVWVDGDYHLKSQAGRWDPASQSWVKDDVTSPCIDAGDPNSPVGDESEPNGGRINMGAYGGTKEASRSLPPQ